MPDFLGKLFNGLPKVWTCSCGITHLNVFDCEFCGEFIDPPWEEEIEKDDD